MKTIGGIGLNKYRTTLTSGKALNPNQPIKVDFKRQGAATTGTITQVQQIPAPDSNLGNEFLNGDPSSVLKTVYDYQKGLVWMLYKSGTTLKLVVGQVIANNGFSGETSLKWGTPVDVDSGVDTYDMCLVESYNARWNGNCLICYDNGSIGVSKIAAVRYNMTITISSSYGTSNTFRDNAINYVSVTYSKAHQVAIVSYSDGISSDKVRCSLGALTGTTNPQVSWGSGFLVDPSGNSGTGLAINGVFPTGSCYCDATNRFILAFPDSSGSTGKCIVGKTPGLFQTTEPTFGSFTDINGGSDTPNLNMVYDHNRDKVVFIYEDQGNSDKGTASVGTVDAANLSISFGSETVFNNENTENIAAAYDVGNKCIAVAYRENGNGYGEAIIGKITSGGTGIAFSSPGGIFTRTDAVSAMSLAFDARNGLFFAVTRTGSGFTGFDGDSYLIRNSEVNNFFAVGTNFVGFAVDGVVPESYTDPITVGCCGTVGSFTTQTLVPGQRYYLQFDGTLGLQRSLPSNQVAGLAIASDKILIKDAPHIFDFSDYQVLVKDVYGVV